jgi:hypothetical protein
LFSITDNLQKVIYGIFYITTRKIEQIWGVNRVDCFTAIFINQELLELKNKFDKMIEEERKKMQIIIKNINIE